MVRDRAGIDRRAGLASLRGGIVCLCLAGFAAQASASELNSDPSAGPVPSPRSTLQAEIAQLKAELAAAVGPDDEELDRLARARAALDEARRSIAEAAMAAKAEQDRSALVLAATIARTVRESRHDAIGHGYEQRLGTALTLSAVALKTRRGEASSRLAVAQRLDVLVEAAARQSERVRDARDRLAEHRSELQERLAEAELALSQLPEPLPEMAAEPVAAEATERAERALTADADPAIAWPAPPSEIPAPAAGPPDQPVLNDYARLVDDLDRLALVAPDMDLEASSRTAQPDPVVNKGWPIAGSISGGFGEDGQGPLDKGLTFVSDLAQPVRAPRSGTVVFAGPFLSFGLLLIVDHGHEYHSLLAGAARLDVRVGDVVVAGQIVGSIDGSEAVPARLYLELRHNGRPINPLPWLAAREDKVRG